MGTGDKDSGLTDLEKTVARGLVMGVMRRELEKLRDDCAVLNKMYDDVVDRSNAVRSENEKLRAEVKELTESAELQSQAIESQHDVNIQQRFIIGSLRAENERLRELLVNWMSIAPVTHNLAGEPISYVQDTRIVLGLKPLEPLKLGGE